MPAGPVSRRWCRCVRFSVRGLLVLVLGIGAGLGWIVHQAHVQRDAVAAVTSADGSVRYDWEWSNGGPIPGGKPWAPRWLVNFIGVDYFGHVVFVGMVSDSPANDAAIARLGCFSRLQELNLQFSSLSDVGLLPSDFEDNRITDTALIPLKGLTRLSSLNLDGTEITDAGLAHLRGLTKLSSLRLNDTRVTDAGLAHLRGMTKLRYLGLDGTHVTDAGLANLDGMTELTSVDLGKTCVTDAGLVHLKGLTKLSSIKLNDTRITDVGVANLKGLTKLSSLDLSNTQVTDAGLAHLKGLTKLSSLDLSNTQVTDAGLAHLKGLTKLLWLDLSNTQVTADGLYELQEALPNLTISRRVNVQPKRPGVPVQPKRPESVPPASPGVKTFNLLMLTLNPSPGRLAILQAADALNVEQIGPTSAEGVKAGLEDKRFLQSLGG